MIWNDLTQEIFFFYFVRAFGILTKRFCIFSSPLQADLDKWSLVCTVAAKLHICVDNNIPEVPRYGPDLWNVYNGDLWNVFLNEKRVDVVHNERAVGEAGSKRRSIALALSAEGINRPKHAMHK